MQNIRSQQSHQSHGSHDTHESHQSRENDEKRPTRLSRMFTGAASFLSELDDGDDDNLNAGPAFTSASTLSKNQGNVWQRFLQSGSFDLLVGMAICANAICIALDQSYRANGVHDDGLKIAENVFLAIYILEVCGRLMAFGYICLRDNWVKFDVLLVVLGMIGVCLTEVQQSSVVGTNVLVLRCVRLLRLVRMVRWLAKFKELWMFVQGIFDSASIICYAMLILAIILFMLASIGLEYVSMSPYATGPDSDPEVSLIVDTYFNSLPTTMLTLVQFVCLDSIGSIYKPLVEKDPALAVYFMLVILILPVVLMNLVTAIFVNGALEQASKHKAANAAREQARRKHLVRKLEILFRRLDQDESGTITREEIANVCEEEMAMISGGTTATDPFRIFDMLDIDGAGYMSIDDFIEGIWQISVTDSTLEMQRMARQVHSLLRRSRELQHNCAGMERTLRQLVHHHHHSHGHGHDHDHGRRHDHGHSSGSSHSHSSKGRAADHADGQKASNAFGSKQQVHFDEAPPVDCASDQVDVAAVDYSASDTLVVAAELQGASPKGKAQSAESSCGARAGSGGNSLANRCSPPASHWQQREENLSDGNAASDGHVRVEAGAGNRPAAASAVGDAVPVQWNAGEESPRQQLRNDGVDFPESQAAASQSKFRPDGPPGSNRTEAEIAKSTSNGCSDPVVQHAMEMGVETVRVDSLPKPLGGPELGADDVERPVIRASRSTVFGGTAVRGWSAHQEVGRQEDWS